MQRTEHPATVLPLNIFQKYTFLCFQNENFFQQELRYRLERQTISLGLI